MIPAQSVDRSAEGGLRSEERRGIASEAYRIAGSRATRPGSNKHAPDGPGRPCGAASLEGGKPGVFSPSPQHSSADRTELTRRFGRVTTTALQKARESERGSADEITLHAEAPPTGPLREACRHEHREAS